MVDDGWILLPNALAQCARKQWKRPSSYKNAFSHSNSTCLGFHLTWGRGPGSEGQGSNASSHLVSSSKVAGGGNSAGWMREEELATSSQRTENGKPKEVSADRMRVTRLLYLII